MAFVIINMGSNLGNRRLNLSRAMNRIGRQFGPFEISHVVETDPYGFASTHRFLNVCMVFSTNQPPLDLLAALQEIERAINGSNTHRNPDGTYADRLLDIDILAYDDLVIDHPRLTLPHPRLAERYFYLKPMEEVCPAWRHPATGLTPAQMLAALPSHP